MGVRRALVTLLAIALVGCGHDNNAPGSESGQYAGRSGGVGGLLDFRARDAVTERIDESLRRRRLRVVVAYLVNHGERPVPAPIFVAERYDGRLSVLTPLDSDAELAPIVPTGPRVISPDGAATMYLLTREQPEAVVRITLRTGGREVTLTPEPAG